MALNPLSVIRAPSPRGAGEKSAVIAMPGPGSRYRGDQWALNRSAWVHPWMPGAAGARFDTKTMQRTLAEDAAIDAGLDQATIAEMTLDELLVLPEVQAVLSGAVISSAQLPISAPPIETQLSSKYTILQSGGIATSTLTGASPNYTHAFRSASGSIPGPILLNGITVSYGVVNNNAVIISVDIGGLGRVFSGSDVTNSDVNPNTITIPCGFIIEKPQPVRIEITANGGLFAAHYVNVNASYQNVARA